MATFTLKREQQLPITLDQAWKFISSPANLKVITPDYMGFDIISDEPIDEMYAGMIIQYYVKPLLGLKMKWVTEITHVKDHVYFVDEQRVGPYSIWHHQHILEPNEKGVLMKDIVTYAPPMGFLGAIMNSIMIKGKLNEIFDYRFRKLESLFPNQ